ncbi:MAG: hypothetical protein A2W80_02750 [Candidatus Riflebacteria bacterium GWC2_50_8]|nr:MAG: hypothetical protein A2W80_02750 [Candidatus Riflebacteria bacterium GWC2_50_8]
MFKIDKQLDKQVLILSVQGYCETEAGQEIFDKINEAFAAVKPTGVIFDFSACKVINSCCISQLIETIELVACDFNCDVVICGLDQTKVTLFKMVGMLELAELKDDVAAALKYLAG